MNEKVLLILPYPVGVLPIKSSSVLYFSERLDVSLVKMSLHKYFKAKSTSKKVIQIASTEANLTATETNEVIRALADDKETPSPSQSSTKRYEVAAEFFYLPYG